MYKSQRFLIALVLGLCWLPAPVKAEKVGLFPLQSVEQSLPKRELLSLSKQLLSQLDLASQSHKVVRKYPLVGGAAPQQGANYLQEKKQELEALTELLEKGVKLMKAGTFEKAVPVLKKGIKKGVGVVRWPETYPIIARLCGLLSLAYLQLGRNDEGEFLLKALAVMQPSPLPPEVKKNRIMLFRYRRTLREVKRQPRGSVQIVGTQGADVYMDGKQQGQIPTVVANLPKGIHYLQIRHKDYIPWGKAVAIKEGVYQVKIVLQPKPKPKKDELSQARQELITGIQLLNLDTQNFRNATRKVCDKTGVRWFFSGHLKKVGRQYRFTPVRTNCKTNETKSLEPVQLEGELLEVGNTLSDVASKLITFPKKVVKRPPPRERKVAVIRKKPIRIPPEPRPKATPVHKTWWFWTILGVTVAGAGAATAVVLLQPPRVSVSVSWPTN